jgi:RNA polymerase sigma-70 factor (ECF subfamily)
MPKPSDPNVTPEPQFQLPLEVQPSAEQGMLAPTGETDLRQWITQLWVRYQGLLLELANFHLRDRDRAQEVVQDTWVDFLKSLSRFEGRCSPKTWLVQILRRRLKKELHRTILRRAREALLGIAKVRSYDEYDARTAPFINRGDNPEKALLMQERLEYILRVSRTLPERQAEVWMLRDLFQWTSEEVSTALTISQENQRILLHRARQRLKLELERYFGQTPAAQSRRVDSHDLQRP